MNKAIMADSFTNVYPVSKTLRFELRPVGKTQEYIERDGIIDTDVTRASNYVLMKKCIDEYHKAFIDSSLQGINLVDLDKFSELYSVKRTEQEEKQFEKIQESLRKQIVARIKADKRFATIFKKELIKKDLLDFYANDEEKKNLINGFSDFTTYFTGFNTNRSNMYSDEAKSTAIGYRVIHQNLPKYLDNMKIYRSIAEIISDSEIMKLEKSLQDKFSIESITDYFCLDGFNNVIPQLGIDIYNTIIGGYSDENGNKVQGLNEYINLYNQKNGTKLPKLKMLFKQILSDKESFSFIPEQFATDSEVFEAIDSFVLQMNQDIFECEDSINVDRLIEEIQSYDLEKIYVRNDTSITTISQALYEDWSIIKNGINAAYEMNNPRGKLKPEKYEEKKVKVLEKVKSYTIAELNGFVLTKDTDKQIEDYFIGKIAEDMQSIKEALKAYASIDQESYGKGKSLKKNDDDIAVIKKLLDSYKEIQWTLKPMICGQNEAEKDEAFYSELIRIWNSLDIITTLYNKVRNYVTGKPYSIEKVKLNFGKSTLLDGWDKNKERDNLGIIMIKNGLYYLGIINRRDTKCIEQSPMASSTDVYKKMEYKLLPGANKMLPKVFFAKSRLNDFQPDDELIKKYKAGTHTKGDNFSLEDCHNLIDFFKRSIEKHEDWSKFDFNFSDTSSYVDISGFYREVENQGYKITYTAIDSDYIDKLVSEGRIYLFQIYNKDFSPYSKGTPNLHTMYWKALFSEENLRDVVYKLNGQAEVFFRKASIPKEQTVIHPANMPIDNKDPLNNKNKSMFHYDIIKNRRFTCDKYQFHVPITMNFQASGDRRFNDKVNTYIQSAENLHIIGIDRGERNLLYISVIDMQGKIVKQLSLNQIMSYDKDNNLHVRDYHGMLVQKEKENVQARQNWTTTGTIKELKEGYLSQVIHVITNLMIEYNAIVVLEDLNFGFKRGRQKFERQVYQKFEKMLIDKLNYLVDKKKDESENGGLLHAYQLTDKFESFQKLGKQTGFLFYVPAWNTSKIDPTTGFVNLFYTKYESVEKSKNFWGAFKRISYNPEGYFEFEFDYKKFTYKADKTRTNWTVCTAGKRISHFRNKDKNNEWDTKVVDLTSDMKKLFEEYNIEISEDDMSYSITSVDDATFYRRLYKLFELTLQMRNSDEKLGIDSITSPVKNTSGSFFVSGEVNNLPLDADANGAYNIAKKGLLLVEKIKATDDIKKVKLTISNAEWLQFAQEYTL